MAAEIAGSIPPLYKEIDMTTPNYLQVRSSVRYAWHPRRSAMKRIVTGFAFCVGLAIAEALHLWKKNR
jgi:hypothetical protein